MFKASGAGLRQIILQQPCTVIHQKHPSFADDGVPVRAPSAVAWLRAASNSLHREVVPVGGCPTWGHASAADHFSPALPMPQLEYDCGSTEGPCRTRREGNLAWADNEETEETVRGEIQDRLPGRLPGAGVEDAPVEGGGEWGAAGEEFEEVLLEPGEGADEVPEDMRTPTCFRWESLY